jgi:uncharacterized membrane protein
MAKKKNQATILRTLLLVTAIFAVSALAMAGLLQYYAKAVGTVTVEQAVVLYDGTNVYDYETNYTFTVEQLFGGETSTHEVFIWNRGGKTANIEFDVKVTNSSGDDVTKEFTVELRVSSDDNIDNINSLSCGTSPVSGSLTIDANKAVKLCIDITPAINQIPDTYTVTVTVIPTTS